MNLTDKYEDLGLLLRRECAAIVLRVALPALVVGAFFSFLVVESVNRSSGSLVLCRGAAESPWSSGLLLDVGEFDPSILCNTKLFTLFIVHTIKYIFLGQITLFCLMK